MRYQRGELSLAWCSVLIGLFAFTMLAMFFSMRYERNFFVDAWERVTHNAAGQLVLQLGQTVAGAVKHESVAVRKCIVVGKTVYSNVECDSHSPGSQQVDLNDSRGIEPPKPPVPDVPQAVARETMKEKMIEKSLSH